MVSIRLLVTALALLVYSVAAGQVIDVSKSPNFCVQLATQVVRVLRTVSVSTYMQFRTRERATIYRCLYISMVEVTSLEIPSTGRSTTGSIKLPLSSLCPSRIASAPLVLCRTPHSLTRPSGITTLDQSRALWWIQAHIDAFGGDPRRVTINGQSAGGSPVELYLVSPPDEGLFSQAIALSAYRQSVTSPQEQEPQFKFFAEQVGCMQGSIGETMSCLRKVSISDLARAEDLTFNGSFVGSHPVVDGNSIVELLPRIIK